MGDEVLHKEEHASCQTDRTQERAGCPDGDECLLAQRAVPGRTVPVDMLRGISHESANSALLSREEANAAHLSPCLARRGLDESLAAQSIVSPFCSCSHGDEDTS